MIDINELNKLFDFCSKNNLDPQNPKHIGLYNLVNNSGSNTPTPKQVTVVSPPKADEKNITRSGTFGHFDDCRSVAGRCHRTWRSLFVGYRSERQGQVKVCPS